MKLSIRRSLAEAIGTYFLVLIGPGAAVVNEWSGGGVSHVGVGLAFAFVVLAVIYAIGHLSGAHINPAVTLGFWSVGRFPGRDTVFYIVAQCSGGVLASDPTVGRRAGRKSRSDSTGDSARAGVPIEWMLSFILMFVIMAVATDVRVADGSAGLAVGLTVGFGALMGGPLTGASMNPARSLGPAVASWTWDVHWLYWIAPMFGMVVAAHVYDFLRKAEVPAVVPRGVPLGVEGPIDPE